MSEIHDPVAGHWSTHQFTEYFAAVSGPDSEAGVVLVAVERAAEAFDAEFASAVVDGQWVQGIGFAAGDPAAAASRCLPVGRSRTEHATLGPVEWLAASMEGHGSTGTSVGGLLVVGRVGSSVFAPEEEQMLRAMATVVGLVLRNLRSLAIERARQNLLRGLLDVQRLISNRRPLQEVLNAVTAATSELLGALTSCLVLTTDDDAETLAVVSRHTRVESSAGQPPETVLESLGGRPPGPADLTPESLVGIDAARRAMTSRSLILIPGGAGADDHDAEQVVAVPVQLRGEYAGALVAWHAWRQRDSAAQVDLLQMFAQQVSVALTDADSVERMNQALHDPLTGLANRSLFLDRLNHASTVATRRGDDLAVLFVDLDGFKAVNDTYGHAAGDEVLRVVAERLRAELRASDTAGRLGGDEFAVLIEGRDPVGTTMVARRLHAALEVPIRLGDVEVRVWASIGIAGDQGGQTPPQTLLALADAAMYRAKRSGRGQTRVHRPSLLEPEQAGAAEVEPDLSGGLATGLSTGLG